MRELMLICVGINIMGIIDHSSQGNGTGLAFAITGLILCGGCAIFQRR